MINPRSNAAERVFKEIRNYEKAALKYNKKAVVYNNCYGGFELPKEGQKLYKKLSGKEYPGDYEVDRHDPFLVKAVLLTQPVCLSIRELKGSKYRIEEYDGLETVQEPDDLYWIEVS